MTVITKKYKWNGNLNYRSATKYIVLHHRAGEGDVDSIHAQHVSQGWTGIGYHYYKRKNGEVYTGRPEKAIGAHCTGYNNTSIGICFEGNYDNTAIMPKEQFDAGRELIQSLRATYPTAKVVGHKDLQATACPGVYFPMASITQEPIKLLTSANDITWALNHSFFPITNTKKFVKELDAAKKNDSSLYWGYYKLVNYIK